MKNKHSLSILIIEDNPGDQLLLQENLKSTSLIIDKVVAVESIKAGLDYINANEFSVLFLDLSLPDSTGLNSLTQLLEANKSLPVIIYSGLGDTEIALKAIALGAQDFLIKGDYSVAVLEKTVLYSLERKMNHDALERSNEKYHLVSKVTHDMVWDWDLVSDTVYRNIEGWKKIFRTKEGVNIEITEDWPKKIHPDDREKTACIVKFAIESSDQDVYEAEFRIIRDDGTVGVLEDRGFIQRDENGVAIRIIGASHDITERKSAENKLHMSEQRFRALVQNSNDLLCILDSLGNYTYVSPTSFKILGYKPEHFIGKSSFEFIHEDDQELTAAALKEIHVGKHFVAPLFRFRNAEGEWRWIESTISNMLDHPAVEGIVVNSRDVTEKKTADDEIKKLSLVAKNTGSSIFILNGKREIVWVNDAFTKITGYTYQEAMGARPSVLLFHPESAPIDFDAIFKKINTGFIYEAERLIKSKSGKRVYVWLQLQTLFNSNGEASQYFGMQTDITEKKELEEKVRFEKLLYQKQITEAVYGAQENERSEIGRELHDNVNQLLGAIKLYVNMAKTDEEGRNSLLNDASDFTMTAIEEIRKLSKTLITPLIDDIGLVDSIKQLAVEIMKVHPLQIDVISDNVCEKEWTYKFKLNIFRICQEQINNVIKHADAAQAIISLKVKDGKVYLSIADNGGGFDLSSKKKGVGLTNIKSRSELYNGIVKISSARGNGTTLTITFDKNELLKNPLTL